jgi:hypothetical protein
MRQRQNFGRKFSVAVVFVMLTPGATVWLQKRGHDTAAGFLVISSAIVVAIDRATAKWRKE